MRAAIPTEAQFAPVAALRYLHVALGHAPQQHKGSFHGGHGCAKRPARQGLTIGTMANDYIVGIPPLLCSKSRCSDSVRQFPRLSPRFRKRSLYVLARTELKSQEGRNFPVSKRTLRLFRCGQSINFLLEFL